MRLCTCTQTVYDWIGRISARKGDLGIHVPSCQYLGLLYDYFDVNTARYFIRCLNSQLMAPRLVGSRGAYRYSVREFLK